MFCRGGPVSYTPLDVYKRQARAYVSGMAQSAAFTKYPLAAAVAIADMYDTYIIDNRGKSEK